MKKQLIKIAKIISIVIGLAVIGVTSLLIYVYIEYEVPKKDILLFVTYSPQNECTEEYPMKVSIMNNTSLTITDTIFEIEVKRNNYSKPLNAPIFSRYSTDRILLPGVNYTSCWKYPGLLKIHENKYEKRDLTYTIINKEFQLSSKNWSNELDWQTWHGEDK